MSRNSTSASPSPTDKFTAARTYLDHLFDTSDTQTSCLSVLPHDLKNVHDLQCHFFGCLDIKNRVRVLDDANHPIWEQAKRLENEDTEPHARSSALEDDDDEQLDMRYITALNLQAELKRVAVLRRTPALKGLVRKVRGSIERWRSENQDNIKMVRDRRQNSHMWIKKNSPPTHISTPRITGISLRQDRSRTGPSNMPSLSRSKHRTRTFDEAEAARQELENDLEKFENKLKEIIQEKRSKDSEPEPEDEEPAAYDLKRDIKARLIKMERPEASGSDASSFMSNVMEPLEENVDDKIFKGSFPDQQVSVHHLLKSKFKRRDKCAAAEEAHKAENRKNETLDRKTVEVGRLLDAETMCPSELRYYHIPVNNMSWVEQAIAGYFDESASNEPGGGCELGPQAKLVLQDGCWRGQEHNGGPGSVVHTRNLRPICEKIATDVEDLYRSGENTQKGLVLFMPFLHWETDRRRNQAANLIEQLTDEHDLEKRETANMWKSKRQQDRDGLDRVRSPDSATPGYREPDYYRPRGRDRDKILQGLAEMLWDKIGDGKLKNMPSGLSHALWQRIRDEAYADKLLVALEQVVYTRPSPARLLSMLQSPTIGPLFSAGSQTPEPNLREWRDVLWEIKSAGRGYPTPHALEDILWNEIKRERKRADAERRCTVLDHLKKIQHPRAKIFQKETTIFKGVEVDEYGHLQPTNILAQVFVKAARLYEEMMIYPDQRLLEKYLFMHPPLHPRRTLDQAYFWRLRNTRLRDRDQVVYRYTNAEHAHRFRPQPPSDVKTDRSRSNEASGNVLQKFRTEKTKHEHWAWTRHGDYEQDNGCDQCDEDIRKVSRAIMVDQLWMWVLDKDTILTCFPQRYGMSKDPSGVHQSIRTRVKTRSNPDNHVLSVFDLALIILDESFDTFFSRTRTPDKRPQVMDMFAESIGRVTNKQAIAFGHLWQLSRRLTDIYQSGVEDHADPALILALLNVKVEAELQREIRDIVDELDIILHIAKQQQDMITRFVKFASQIIEADLAKCTVDGPQQTTYKLLQQQQSAFKTHSDDLLSEIVDRINELSGMKTSAESTAQNVNDLLDLKQQQASVVQAYEAMKQGEETVRQGKAIMVFTVMTIIFLPLSFMSSLFGMNAVELTGTDPSPGAGSPSSSNSSAGSSSGATPDEIVPFYPTTFKRQVLVMFTVSFGAVLLIIIPAFSPFIRALTSAMFHRSTTKIITWTGLYKLWLKSGLKSKDVRGRGLKNVSKMKNKVRDALARQNLQESEIWDGVRERDKKKVPHEGIGPAIGTRAEEGAGREVANGVPPPQVDMRRSQDLEKGQYF